MGLECNLLGAIVNVRISVKVRKWLRPVATNMGRRICGDQAICGQWATDTGRPKENRQISTFYSTFIVNTVLIYRVRVSVRLVLRDKHRYNGRRRPVYEPCTTHTGRTGLRIQHAPGVSCIDCCPFSPV